MARARGQGGTGEGFEALGAEMPLVRALGEAIAAQRAPFHTPGHRGGRGMGEAVRRLLGEMALAADLPELPGLDNLFAPTGPIRAAQDRAAQTFGAEETFFLANGSTSGLEAAILATVQPGDRVLIPRNGHRSLLAGGVLAGVMPVYGQPVGDGAWDLPWGLDAPTVAQILAAVPDIRAVVMVSPNYQGICGPVRAIAALAHQAGIPLIVDAAHGAHLGFHPDLPPSALSQGADLVVQSTHKTLSALTQGAMLHCQGQRVDRDRLRRALALTQSTSPNYLILASLDGVQAQMGAGGADWLAPALELAATLRQGVADLGALALPRVPPQGSFTLDPTRLTVDVSPLGLTGFAADEFLHDHQGVTVELPTLRQLTGILTGGNCPAHGERWLRGLAALCDQPSAAPFPDLPPPPTYPPYTLPPLSPRQAFFAPHRLVPLGEAVGHLCGDSICPYPPGIPLLLPGERITPGAIAYLQMLQGAGGVITGLTDDVPPCLPVVSPMP